jgi:hypothetical protein
MVAGGGRALLPKLLVSQVKLGLLAQRTCWQFCAVHTALQDAMRTQPTHPPWLLQFVGNGSLLEKFHQAYWLGLATTAWPVFKWMDPLVLGGCRTPAACLAAASVPFDVPHRVQSVVCCAIPLGRQACTWWLSQCLAVTLQLLHDEPIAGIARATPGPDAHMTMLPAPYATGPSGSSYRHYGVLMDGDSGQAIGEPYNKDPPYSNCAVANYSMSYSGGSNSSQRSWGWAAASCNARYVFMCRTSGGVGLGTGVLPSASCTVQHSMVPTRCSGNFT